MSFGQCLGRRYREESGVALCLATSRFSTQVTAFMVLYEYGRDEVKASLDDIIYNAFLPEETGL